jgi:hypothetical protein
LPQADEVCGSSAAGPFRRLTARFQARSYAGRRSRIGSAMNFVLQPWQLLLAVRAVGVTHVGGLPHRYTRVA